MHRRELLRVMGTAAALPMLGALSIEELLALGSDLHSRQRPHGAPSFEFLTPHEGATVTALAEAIIPETDTPGATGAGVPAFIDLLVGEWYDDDAGEAFREGLRDVDARSRQSHGTDFIEIDGQSQAAVLGEMEAEANRLRGSDAQPFFRTLKWLTLFGYYTSEVGAVQALNYTMIPGRFDGCVPLVPTERR